MSKNININYSEYNFFDALDEEIMYEYSIEEAEKSGFKLNFNKITENEIEIGNLVDSTVMRTHKPKLEEVHDIDSVIQKAITSLDIFGREYIDYVSKIDIKIAPKSDFLAYATLFTNIYYIENGLPIGDTKYIIIPDKLYKVSPIIIGHEYIHSIKEIYYYEKIDKLRFSEVIPQFYELLAVESKSDDVKEEWLKLKKYIQYEIKNSKNNYESTEYLNEKLGLYYSLLIYNLYRKYPDKVLSGVNDVLKHKKTTEDLLKEMEIYKINKEKTKIYKQEKRIIFN